jgi:hypothetical protein
MKGVLILEKYLTYDGTMDILYYICNDVSADIAKVSCTYPMNNGAPCCVCDDVSSDHSV